jgi:hypothetical protein
MYVPVEVEGKGLAWTHIVVSKTFLQPTPLFYCLHGIQLYVFFWLGLGFDISGVCLNRSKAQ